MKTCGLCKEDKSLSEFNKKTDRQYQPYCRICDNKKSRERYAANREHHIETIAKRNKVYKKEVDEYIRNIKSITPCTDCNNKYHWFQMDFDHVRGKKDRPVSEMAAQKVSLSRIKLEIEKCELVCANCHRLRTYSRSLQKNI